MWKGMIHICTLAAFICLGIGCKTPQDLRPPTEPDRFTVPPEGDPRFSGPPNYQDKDLFHNIRNEKTAPFQKGAGARPSSGLRPGGGPGGFR